MANGVISPNRSNMDIITLKTCLFVPIVPSEFVKFYVNVNLSLCMFNTMPKPLPSLFHLFSINLNVTINVLNSSLVY
jgi:hypothetical protein